MSFHPVHEQSVSQFCVKSKHAVSGDRAWAAAAKLEEMQSGLDEVVGKIHGLEQRKAALLQELEVLDQHLFKVRLLAALFHGSDSYDGSACQGHPQRCQLLMQWLTACAVVMSMSSGY